MGLGLIKFRRRLFDWGNSYDVESLDLGGMKITDVGAPSAGGDAVNKTYADGIAGVTGVIKADGSVKMAGALDMDSHKVTNVTDPTSAQDGATKKYVDDQDGLNLKKDGSVKMAGALDMDSHKVTNVTDPTSPQDAATKNYVDSNGGLIDAKTDKLLRGRATLTGQTSGITEVVFGDPTAAVKMGTIAGPWDLSGGGAGDGATLIATPDGGGAQTATINAAAGYHTGAVGALTDMSAVVEDKFKIAVDGAAPVEVECDFVGETCDTGNKIATEMQTKIRAALGGALVTVAFDTDHYVITSPTLGTGSAIEVDNAADHDCADELDLTDGATPTAGTGDVADLSAVTLDEIIAVCEADMSGLVVDEEGGALVFESDSVGNSSSLAIGSGTLNSVLGLTGSAEYYGTNGLDYVVSITATSYVPIMTLNGATSIAGKGFSVRNKTAAGFDIYCETAGAADQVGIIVQIDDE
jgi:hypothetical protein